MVVQASRRHGIRTVVFGWRLLSPTASVSLPRRLGRARTHRSRCPTGAVQRRRGSPWGKPGLQAGTCWRRLRSGRGGPPRHAPSGARCGCGAESVSRYADCWPARVAWSSILCDRLDPDLGRFFNHVMGQHHQTAHFRCCRNGRLIFREPPHHPASNSRTPQSMEAHRPRSPDHPDLCRNVKEDIFRAPGQKHEKLGSEYALQQQAPVF